MHDVEQRFYPSVVREMIRHENEVTNHRIMWLLIGQGLIANAVVSSGEHKEDAIAILAPVGVLVAFSAFIILYKSYHARGYLLFLGLQAKSGALREEHLPLSGWPRTRIKAWWRKVWMCPWLGRPGDLLEPYLFLPLLLILAWLFLLLRHWLKMNLGALLAFAALLDLATVAALCTTWVAWNAKDEEKTDEPSSQSPRDYQRTGL